MTDQPNDQSAAFAAPSLDVAERTDIGLRRRRNEDYSGVHRTPHGLLMVVCDGMGGHAGGDVAARIAVETFCASVEADDGTPADLLKRAVERANQAILDEAIARPEYMTMGTTLVGALLVDGAGLAANVGDSRGYLLRAGALQRLTRDHSLVGEMVARGEITQEEAAVHPRRNVVTRVLGDPNGVEADLVHFEIGDDDVLLLASDGLHGMVSDAVIAEVLGTSNDATAAADLLVARALAAGGTDNVTVIVARRARGIHSAPAAASEGQRSESESPGKRPRKRPRGLGLIIGLTLGTLLLIAVLMYAARLVVTSMQQRDNARADSTAVYVPNGADSMATPGSAAPGSPAPGTSGTDSLGGDIFAPGDSTRIGDTLR